MSRGTQTIRQQGFTGLNTRLDPSLLSPDQAQRCRNLDLWAGRLDTRPGTKRLATSRAGGGNNTCQGLYQFRDRGGVLRRVGVFGGVLYSFDYPWTAWTTIGTLTGGVDEYASFASDGNVLFIATGNDLWVWDSDNGEFDEYQLDAPSTSLSVSVSLTAGSLTAGAYLYQYTYYSSLTGAESAPSTGEGDTALGSDSMDMTIPSIPGGYWDKIRLYRTTAGGATYQLVATIGSAGAYNDGLADADLGDAITTTSDTVLGNGTTAPKYVVYHGGRLWFGGLTADGQQDRVYFSEAALPHRIVSTNFDRVTGAAGEPVTAMYSLRGHLMVFTRHTATRYSGDPSAASFTEALVEGGKGCLSHASQVEVDGVLFRLTDEGVSAFTGFSDTVLTEAIQDFFVDLGESNSERIDPDQGWEASAAYLRHRRCYLLAYTREGQTEPDRCIAVYLPPLQDGRLDGRPLLVTWGGGSGGSINPRGLANIEDDSAVTQLLWGDQYGYLYRVDAGLEQDGAPSAVSSGTATSGSATTVVDSGASFPTTNDGLARAYVTVIRAADGSIETQQITSNTSTTLTTASFSGTAPAAGDAYHVGAIDADYIGPEVVLASEMAGRDKRKYIPWLTWAWSKQTHGGPLRVGWRKDNESGEEEPDGLKSLTTLSGPRSWAQPVNHRMHSITPRARSIGSQIPMSVIEWGLEFRPSDRR